MGCEGTRLRLEVPGRPQSQGNKSGRVIFKPDGEPEEILYRRKKLGTRWVYEPVGVPVVNMFEGKGKAGSRLKKWRKTIGQAARLAMGNREPLPPPYHLILKIYFDRPKSHYGTGRNAGKLRPSAPPDNDVGILDSSKVLRGVEDALEGIAIVNDSKITCHNILKRWTCGEPRTIIFLESMR